MKILFEWGLSGAKALADYADVLIVVDVLSFSTCVDVACARGAQVFPFPLGDRDAAIREAERLNVILAGKRSDKTAEYTLSAPTLRKIPTGTKLMLPSPNGSRISFSTQGKTVLAGCLRNAKAVAQHAVALSQSNTIAVIAAGERWPDGGLRPAIEDFIGSGAIIAELQGDLSAEARVARNTFLSAGPDLSDMLHDASSSIELKEKGFPQDVEIALELNVSNCVPVLLNGAYSAA